MVECIFVNGTVGAGKTSLADELSEIETVRHAVIDLDHIRRLRPAPASDRFNHELELQNLRAMATNFRAAGAERFILAGVIEERAEIGRYTEALGVGGIFVCRVIATPEVVAERLRKRHADDAAALKWHLARAGELAGILDTAAVDDLVLDSSVKTAGELARTVRRAAGWA